MIASCLLWRMNHRYRNRRTYSYGAGGDPAGVIFALIIANREKKSKYFFKFEGQKHLGLVSITLNISQRYVCF